MPEERLQKILAQAGIASRRSAEKMILEGRVRVDGRVVTELGTKANTRAKVEVDGKRIASEQKCYGVLHKPRGVMTTLSDPEGRPTIEPLLSSLGVRVVPIGRLDFNTSGALLFTNDGDFAQALSHARGGAPKVYVAKIQGKPTERALERWRESIEVEGKRTRPADVRVLRQEEGKTWLEVTLIEGRNRQVRRLGEHAGTEVVRLSRLSHAGISVEGVRTGTYRLLSPTELKELRKTYGVPRKISGVMEGGERFGGASSKSRMRAKPLTGASFVRRPRESEDDAVASPRSGSPRSGSPRSRSASPGGPRGVRDGSVGASRGPGGKAPLAQHEPRMARGRPLAGGEESVSPRFRGPSSGGKSGEARARHEGAARASRGPGGKTPLAQHEPRMSRGRPRPGGEASVSPRSRGPSSGGRSGEPRARQEGAARTPGGGSLRARETVGGKAGGSKSRKSPGGAPGPARFRPEGRESESSRRRKKR